MTEIKQKECTDVEIQKLIIDPDTGEYGIDMRQDDQVISYEQASIPALISALLDGKDGWEEAKIHYMQQAGISGVPPQVEKFIRILQREYSLVKKHHQ